MTHLSRQSGEKWSKSKFKAFWRQRSLIGSPQPRPGVEDRRLSRAIADTRSYLLSKQHEDGHWCAELEGDTILESEYILAMHFLGRTGEEKVRKAASYLRQRQLPDGGWAMYPGGAPELSSSVKAYFVLKLVGDDPRAPHMEKAREVILSLGGLDACNSFTKIYLSIFGQYEWSKSPGVPPELILFPKWYPYFNIYDDVVVVAGDRGASEHHLGAASRTARCRRARLHPRATRVRPRGLVLPQWSRASLLHEGWSLVLPRSGSDPQALRSRTFCVPLRRLAVRRCEQWVLQRLENSDGLGSDLPADRSTPSWLCAAWAILEDHPTVAGQIRELEKLEMEEEDDAASPALLLPGLGHGTVADRPGRERRPRGSHGQLHRAVEWLLEHEVGQSGGLAGAGIPKGRWEVGTSSTPTSSIPTATTPPRSSTAF